MAEQLKLDDEHEYVDLMLEFKDGQIVGCEFYGEGRQAAPITEPMFFKPIEGDVQTWPRGWDRIVRRMNLALRRLAKAPL